MTHKLSQLWHPFRVVGRNWSQLKGKTIKASTVDVLRCGDIHGYKHPPKFPNAEKVLIRNCDKNFVYYWLNESMFPKVKEIWLDSHPCEWIVFQRFPKANWKLPIPTYIRYKNDWFSGAENRFWPVERSAIQYEAKKITEALEKEIK